MEINIQANLVEYSFTNIHEFLSNDNDVKLVRKKGFKQVEVFNRFIPELINIMLHDGEKRARDNACNILTSKLSFTNEETLVLLVNSLINFISSDDNLDHDSLRNFSSIFHYLIQTTNCCVLLKYCSEKNLMPSLLRRMDHPSITNLLDFMTNDKSENMGKFLGSEGMAELLLKMAMGIDRNRERLLELIINILSSFSDGKYHYDAFNKRENFQNLLEIALGRHGRTTILALKIVYMILDIYVYYTDEEKKEDILFQVARELTMNNASKMVEIIVSANTFSMSSSNIVNVLLKMAELGIDIYDELVEITIHLFKMMNVNLNNANLHNTFLKVVNFLNKPALISKLRKIIEKLNIAQSIIEAVSIVIPQMNIGFFFALAKIIYENEEISNNLNSEEWNNFINEVYIPRQKIISGQYGGKINRSVDEYEEFDDSDEGFICNIDKEAREAAIIIFGYDLITGIEENTDDFYDDGI